MKNPKQISGRGLPPASLDAEPGQKYRDLDTQIAYIFTTDRGWVKASVTFVDTLPEIKRHWNQLSEAQSLTIEEWIIANLPGPKAKQGQNSKRYEPTRHIKV